MFLVRGSLRWTTGEVPIAEFADLGRQVRERHPGNIDYRFSIDTGDPTLVLLQEAWEEAANFAHHGTTPEVAAIGALVARGGADVQVTTFEVSSARRVIPAE